MTPTNDLMTAKEAGEFLRMTPGALSIDRSRYGRFPYVKLGKRVLYSRSALEQIIQANTHTPKKAA